MALFSCGGGSKSDSREEAKKDDDKPKNGIEALAEMGEKMKEGANAEKKVMEERKKKGDTLAMHYTELEKYLPESVDGYKKGEPTGATVNYMSASYSNAEVTFTKGNERVRVTILDYNQTYALYSMATMAWAMGMSIDSPDEKAGGIKLDNTNGGWETFHKKSHDAEVVLGVGYRFLVTVNASGQDNTDLVKSIAKSMNLSKLASL